MSKHDTAQVTAFIAEAASFPVKDSEWFTSAGELKKRRIPFGCAHDFASLQIGSGEAVFTAAQNAFARWKQFDLGWVHVANPEAALALGQIVAVEVRTIGLWSLNLSRIVRTVNTPTRFGFAYATTSQHVERGEELFLLNFDPQTRSVTYLLEAVSHPQDIFARVGYAFTRAMQRRFARESLMRVRDVVRGR